MMTMKCPMCKEGEFRMVSFKRRTGHFKQRDIGTFECDKCNYTELI